MLSIAVEGESDRTVAQGLLARAEVTDIRLSVAKGALGPSLLGRKRLAEIGAPRAADRCL